MEEKTDLEDLREHLQQSLNRGDDVVQYISPSPTGEAVVVQLTRDEAKSLIRILDIRIENKEELCRATKRVYGRMDARRPSSA